jgi:ATP-dependent DNA helicase RecQ
MFVCPDDLCALENFAHGDTPTRDSVRGLLGDVFGAKGDFDLSIYECAGRHDIRPLVVQTLLAYLELAGHLQAGTPFYSRYSFQPLTSSQEMLARFAGERREFLAQVLRQSRKAKTWFHIDLEQAGKAIGQPRERIVRAYDYLAEQRLIELRAEGVRQTYRRLQTPGDLDALADDLYGRLVEREQREIGRLEQVLALAGRDGCQTAMLAEHFGERFEKTCGHCTWCCNGQKPAPLLPRREAPIDEGLWRQARALAAEKRDVLGAPRPLARFLCGLSSPRVSAARLGGHALFGSLADAPFAKVLQRAESELR